MGIPRARQGIIAVLLLLLLLFPDKDDDMALVFEVLPLSQGRQDDDTPPACDNSACDDDLFLACFVAAACGFMVAVIKLKGFIIRKELLLMKLFRGKAAVPPKVILLPPGFVAAVAAV